MTLATRSEVYRIALSGRVCRSGFALLQMNVASVGHIVATTVSDSNTLIVVAEKGYDLYDQLVTAVVASGFDPFDVTVAELERIIDPEALTLDEAKTLGLVVPPKEPVRAEVVQRIAVHVTDGYDPDRILVDSGVPVELAFSEGHGCLGRVVFDSLNIEADLENGGALIKLPALEAGTYPFRCGRDLVHGLLIAE
jgi:hypothetical protein